MSPAVRSIDSTLKTGTTLARSGMWDLIKAAPGRTALRPKPPASRSSASQLAPQNPSVELPRDPVGAAGAERGGASRGLSPPTSS